MTTYDGKAFSAAHRKFLEDAKSLTDDDIAQFAIVDAKFAERARARRAGFVEPIEPGHRDKTPVTRGFLLKALQCVIANDLTPLLATYRYRIDELVTRVAELEQHVKSADHGGSYSPAARTLPDVSDLIQ